MALPDSFWTPGVDWSEAVRHVAKKYEVRLLISAFDAHNPVSLLREKMVSFTIEDRATPEQLMSFKTRARGTLVVIADCCTKIAEHFSLGVYVASSDGAKRDKMIRRRVRIATDEEQSAGKPMFVSELEPLNAEDLWEEFARGGASFSANPRRKVTIAFRQNF